MKKISFLLLLAMTLVFASCKDEASHNALSMIPADATFVGSVNVGSIIQKAGITVENGNVTFPDSYSALVQSGMGENDMKALNELTQSGIDLTGKIYMFGDKSAKGVFIIPLTDASAAKTYITNQTGKEVVADGDLYKVDGLGHGSAAYLSDSYIVAAMQYSGDDIDNYMKGIINVTNQTSIADNAEAMTMLGRDDDLTMYGDYNRILAMSGMNASQLIASAYGEEYAGLAETYKGMGYTLNFGKKEVELFGKMFYDENNELIKQALKAVGKPSAEGLKFMPADMQLVLSVSLNGEELAKNEMLVQLIDKAFTPQVAKIITKDETLEYIGSIDGPVTLGWNYVDYATSRDMHVYGAIKTDKADELCQKIQSTVTAQLQGVVACSKMGDEYVVNLLGQQVFAFGSKDGFFHFRSVPQQVKESMYDNDIARGIFDKAPSGLYANLLKGSRANNQIVTMMPKMQFSAYAEAEATDLSSGTFKIVIEEPEGDNSLETILSVVANAMN